MWPWQCETSPSIPFPGDTVKPLGLEFSGFQTVSMACARRAGTLWIAFSNRAVIIAVAGGAGAQIQFLDRLIRHWGMRSGEQQILVTRLGGGRSVCGIDRTNGISGGCIAARR
jgi:hypothetical protein